MCSWRWQSLYIELLFCMGSLNLFTKLDQCRSRNRDCGAVLFPTRVLSLSVFSSCVPRVNYQVCIPLFRQRSFSHRVKPCAYNYFWTLTYETCTYKTTWLWNFRRLNCPPSSPSNASSVFEGQDLLIIQHTVRSEICCRHRQSLGDKV